MKKLRSFVYLNNYKMYSFSSQLFEGLTEYILKNENSTSSKQESQKGPIGSGQILADILEINTSQSEKKFLHDFSYNLFEEKLIDEKKVIEITEENYDSVITTVRDYSFIKISGKVIFKDMKKLEETTSSFNKFGEAVGYITMRDSIEQTNELKKQVEQIKDRNERAKQQAILNSTFDFKKYLKDNTLQLDQTFLDYVSYILNYGYSGQFEVQIPIGKSIFSATLNREFLKESESDIVKKYSRETEREFKLFGILTQSLNSSEKEDIVTDNENADAPSMKEAIMALVSGITRIETLFTGKLDNEYVIDPIALYLEI
ncbi:MAG: hypothetical protein J0L80_17115 [Chitinophagales bacterium]|nr:hypothetical protein [Chitinophagales bacterium]